MQEQPTPAVVVAAEEEILEKLVVQVDLVLLLLDTNFNS